MLITLGLLLESDTVLASTEDLPPFWAKVKLAPKWPLSPGQTARLQLSSLCETPQESGHELLQ